MLLQIKSNDIAGKVGAAPYKEWGAFQPPVPTPEAFSSAIIMMGLANPNLTFHFNLTDGLTGNRIDKTANDSNFAHKVTTAEFNTVVSFFSNRTTFYVKSGSIYKPINLK